MKKYTHLLTFLNKDSYYYKAHFKNNNKTLATTEYEGIVTKQLKDFGEEILINHTVLLNK